jgi:hypothetical protein
MRLLVVLALLFLSLLIFGQQHVNGEYGEDVEEDEDDMHEDVEHDDVGHEDEHELQCPEGDRPTQSECIISIRKDTINV